MDFAEGVFAVVVCVLGVVFMFCHWAMCFSTKEDPTIPPPIRWNPTVLYFDASYLSPRGKKFRRCALFCLGSICLLVLTRLVVDFVQ